MATLPSEYRRPSCSIGNMQVGDKGYSVSWAMDVDAEGTAFLGPNYTIYPETGGTVQLAVERQQDGYHIYLGGSDYQWDRVRIATGLPVQEIHTKSAGWGVLKGFKSR